MSQANLRLLESKLEKERAYWSDKLSGELHVSGLELDFPRPATFDPARSTLDLPIEPEIQRSLFSICGNSETLILTALVAALKVYLYKSTGVEDVIIGTTIHREYSELATLNKILALRDRLTPGMSAKSLLLDIKRTLLDAYAHQKYPFAKILELLEVERPNNRAPLFDIVVILENINRAEHIERLKNDVTLIASVQEGALSLSIEYNSCLFERDSIEVFGHYYQRLLDQILNNPDAKIADLELLSPAEEHRLLYEFNDTYADYPLTKTAHLLFEEQVEGTPDEAALYFGDRQLSYEQLNSRSNQLAHHLLHLGVSRGSRVGVLLEHSFDTLVALLGVLKAGAAYVPLDPLHPPARLSFALRDCSASLLLTHSRLRQSLPAGVRLPTLCLDTEWPQLAHHPTSNPQPLVTPLETAYIIYTSGSTGVPKGVAVTHRSLVNYLWWARATYLRGDRLNFALYSSLAFDLTVTSLFTPLISGSALVIFPADQATALSQILSDGRVGALKLTPSHLALLLSQAPGRAAGLRRLIVGGEALLTELARQAARAFGAGVELYNEYGPTEATVGCMAYRYEAGRDERVGVPIGRPAANTEIYVLDEGLGPVGLNLRGEVYIGGEGVARGYWGRAGLTAERFVPDPLSREGGGRLYRSGDEARVLASGEVEYLGRGDGQVKVRGHRVELGEVREAALRHPEVRDAVVRVERDGGGREAVVCYYVARREVEAGELRRAVCEYVYAEAAPRVWVHLRKLPLTLNGKVNYDGLPKWEDAQARRRQGRGDEAPLGPVEELLAGIWAEVLGVGRVGAGENFFELGGHSLLATQVVSRVREALGVEVGLRNMFEEPTVRGLARAVEGLRGVGAWALPPLRRVQARRGGEGGVGREYVLSYAQQRLWFVEQLQPGSAAYNIPAAVRVRGQLNVAALERSFGEIVRRHEVLRTTFSIRDGEPVQVIGETLPYRLSVEEVGGGDAQEREAEMHRRARAEAGQAFDLRRGPLMRARLLKLEEEDHVVLLTMHHIISDGWSMGVLIREIGELYRAYGEGRESGLEEPPVQYADYAEWQREWLQGEALERQLAYWREQLAGAPELVELPTDRPRPAVQSHKGGTRRFEVGGEIAELLRQMSRREGVTLFMTLLAAFKTLLHRYTEQEDIVIGTNVANRRRTEAEALIGFFSNMLVLRTHLKGDMTFRELLGCVREVALGAYAHQDLPFERIVEELHPQRTLSYNPIFQVVFSMQNTPHGSLELPGLKSEQIDIENQTSQFDLTVNIWDNGDRLTGLIIYNSDLFEATTIELLLEHYQIVLDNVVADPDRRVGALPLLSPRQRRYLLSEWNDSSADFPRHSSLPLLFRSQAALSPHAPALLCGDESLSYAELDSRSDQLAHHLLHLGVSRGSRVGVLLEHSFDTLVALLGVLKAGAAYVPLDPLHPPARLRFAVADSGAALLLTHSRLRRLRPELPADTRVLCLDADRQAIARQRTTPCPCPPTADDLAYVIYTSGSTGVPKGVAVTHRSLVNYLWWARATYLRGDRLNFALYSSLAFDLTVTSLFTPLISGSALVIFPADQATALSQILSDGRVGALKLTPSHLALLLSQAPGRAAGLRRLIVGGEALLTELARQAARAFGAGVELYNEYGPTEATVGCMAYRYEAGRDERVGVPIGRPAANTEIYVLDEGLGPVGLNLRGEVYIGGEGVARGYWGRAGLTAERFVPNPLSRVPGARLYRSGDEARVLASGEVEYLGRGDGQVKYHGFRMELEELREVLCRHEQVRDGVVRLERDERGREVLVCYYVARQALEVAELRRWMGQYVYAETIPQVWVHLRRMPLTLNGKVNYEGLPKWEEAAPRLPERRYEAAQSPVEELLADIWAEVLGVERVGVDENFFELRGHSLLATQVISRVHETLGVEVALRNLFEKPTVREFAGVVGELRRGGVVAMPPLKRAERRRRGDGEDGAAGDEGGEEREYRVSFAQQRLWFIEQLQPDSTAYNIGVGVRLCGRLDMTALERTLEEVVQRHEVLRTSFREVDGEPVQVVSEAGGLRLEVSDLSGKGEAQREAEVRRLAEAEAGRAFNLETGPLLRVRVVRLSEQEHVVLLTMHHIISDGWSMGVLIREIGELYRAYGEGRESGLEEPPVQYADYAEWQREWLQGEALERQLAYWREQLAHVPRLELPTDFTRPPAPTGCGAKLNFQVPVTLAEQLRQLSRKEGVTLFMTLVAAFKALLYRYTEQEEVVVGTNIANRRRVETESLIGFFVNNLVLRSEVRGEWSFRELLKHVREVCLGAYAHQDVPFEKLVEELQPERSLQQNPLFQVVFVLQNAPQSTLQLPDLTMELINLDDVRAMFDLTFNLWETTQSLEGVLIYSTDLFSAETMSELLKHYRNLLEGVVADPEREISSLALVSAEEAEQLSDAFTGVLEAL